ncbi:MAG TPA: FAD-dependent oxidoreductase, partial [Firmicutes bacterium]|nr:FAD-dependent oxidoreductase [Bacillota bacterium]
RVLILDQGPALEERHCAHQEAERHCRRCRPCQVTCGWGGAGAFSDGKLTLTSEFGGFLSDYLHPDALNELINYVDQLYLSFGAPDYLYGTDQEEVKELQRKAASAGLSLIPARIRHLGTDNCFYVLQRIFKQLSSRVDIATDTPVAEVLTRDRAVEGVKLVTGEVIRSRFVVCSPGRSGAEWFQREASRLGLKGTNNPVDIGVRVEIPAVLMEPLTSKVYEPKLVYFSPSFDDRIRTFCMNPHGVVVMENNGGLITVNGHSYARKKTENTNFALLVSKTFTEPFNEPICYGKNIAGLANMLGHGVLVQRLGDLLMGRRSTRERIQRGMVRPSLEEATPGDLSLVLPYRHLCSLIEMLEALDKLVPGINSSHTLLYGIEVKFYSFRVQVNSALQTDIRHLFAIGDGAGITRGLIQSSASGVIAARQIACSLGNNGGE